MSIFTEISSSSALKKVLSVCTKLLHLNILPLMGNLSQLHMLTIRYTKKQCVTDQISGSLGSSRRKDVIIAMMGNNSKILAVAKFDAGGGAETSLSLL